MSSELTLQLFVAGASSEIETTRERVVALLDAVLKIPYRFDVIDVLENPQLADLAHILVTPTLVIRFNSTERRVVGDLKDLTKLRVVLADSQPV